MPHYTSSRARRGLTAFCVCLALACAACGLVSPAAGSGRQAAAGATPAAARGAVAVPESGFAQGWVKSGPTLRFSPTTLYDYIDGGAELFLEFGFVELLVQRYARGGVELTLEIYRMESPEAALGIYLARSDAETPVEGIKARNTGSYQQVTVLKGSVFLQVNNFGGGDESLPVMTALVNRALERVPEGKPVTLLSNLPRKDLVPGSEALVRGQFGLQPIFTFGSGDALLLSGKVFAVLGDYHEAGTGPDAAPYTRILVLYPSKSTARRAFDHLVTNLDPYLEVVRKGAGGEGGPGATAHSGPGPGEPWFVFKDYQGKFGSVGLTGRRMDIKVNLSKEPQ